MDLSPWEKKAFAFSPKPGAFISFVSTGLIVADVLKSPKKRKTVYHRLMLAMCCNSMVQSCLFFWGTWAFPKDVTPQAFNAMGTTRTCSFQGFMLQFGYSVPFYYASLSYYSFHAVRNQFSEDALRRIEPWIHIFVYAFPLSSAICLLLTESINPSRSICWIEAYPLGCEVLDHVTCIRGSAMIRKFIWVFVGGPLFFFLGYATIMMARLYHLVRTMERKKQSVVGKKKWQLEARYTKSRSVARQATLYLAAFYVTYILPITNGLITFFMSRPLIPLTLASSAVTPLQGFFFSVVYIQLQASSTSTKRRRSAIATRNSSAIATRNSSTAEIIISNNGTMPETAASEIARSVKMHRTSKTSQILTIKLRRQKQTGDFSIFDGTNPSDEWKEFFQDQEEEEEQSEEEHDDDEEDDEEESIFHNNPNPNHNQSANFQTPTTTTTAESDDIYFDEDDPQLCCLPISKM